MILPALANKLGVFKHSYTVIDCGSKQNIPLYIKLMNKFKIPYVSVYDKDHQENKSEQAIGAADSATKAILDEINNELGLSVELVNDIEQELGYPFQALKHIKSSEFHISESFAEKIRVIYK